jgi:hypothetical protein
VFGVWFLVSGVVLWCHVRVRLPGELNVRHDELIYEDFPNPVLKVSFLVTTCVGILTGLIH